MAKYRKVLLALCLFTVGVCVHAQYLRTSYFMEGVSSRLQLNPALQPTNGYINIPVLGSFNIGASSNVLGTSDIIDILDSGEDLFSNDALYNRLKTDNHLNVNLNTELLSFGWHRGKGFWSVNVGLRADVGASIPKSMFEYMRDANGFSLTNGIQSYKIGNERFDLNAYAEVGVGYSRQITDKLTVGGRFNVLLGIARAEMEINRFDVEMDIPDVANAENLRPEDWYGSNYSYNVQANLVTSYKGGGLDFDQNGYISGFDFGGGFGIAGTGFDIDLGASYQIFDNLTVSAAVLDLGFIKWKDNVTTAASVSEGESVVIDQENYDKYINDDFLNLDRFNLRENNAAVQSSKTRLASTIVLAGEYGFFENKLAVGAIYTTRFVEPKTQNELTFSATYRPKNWFNAAISYSPVQAGGKSLGLGLKLGSLFLGTDYMFFGNNSKSVNGFIGISIPLGAKKSDVI